MLLMQSFHAHSHAVHKAGDGLRADAVPETGNVTKTTTIIG
jgi:hypothetical protein